MKDENHQSHGFHNSFLLEDLLHTRQGHEEKLMVDIIKLVATTLFVLQIALCSIKQTLNL